MMILKKDCCHVKMKEIQFTILTMHALQMYLLLFTEAFS